MSRLNFLASESLIYDLSRFSMPLVGVKVTCRNIEAVVKLINLFSFLVRVETRSLRLGKLRHVSLVLERLACFLRPDMTTRYFT